MKLDVLGKEGYIVSSHEVELVENALFKIKRIFKDSISGDIKVYLKRRNNQYKIEISIYLLNSLFRSEDSHKNINSALSAAADKLYSQMLKGKEKIKNRFARRGEVPFEDSFINEKQNDEPVSKIVKNKRIILDSIEVDEALLEIEQLGHSFYVYRDSSTNRVCIIYKRADGEFGLIETE